MTGGVRAATANTEATTTVLTGTHQVNFQTTNGRSASPSTPVPGVTEETCSSVNSWTCHPS